MSFLSRWLSSDYRRALAAEAVGDYPLAARLYAQCGESRKVAEMQLLQVGPQTAREEVLGRLREAARWAHGESTLLRRAAQGIEREGRRDTPTVPPDGELLREAAALYERAGAFRQAAQCLEGVGEPARAADLWGRAGDLARMEALLDREREGERVKAELREAWEEYRLELAAGRRERARAAMEKCCTSPAATAERPEYLRLRADLDTRRRQGFVALRGNLIYVGTFPVALGRDGTSGLALHDGSVSRQHAHIDFSQGQFVLVDCGSRNGTRLDGIAISEPIALGERGEIGLGDDCGIAFFVHTEHLELRVTRGRDRGWRLLAGQAPFELAPGVRLRFEAGRPIVRSERGPFRLAGQLASSEIEWISGDVASIADMTWEVL